MTDKNNQDSWNNKEPARKILPLPDTDNADDTAMMSLIRIIRITRLKIRCAINPCGTPPATARIPANYQDSPP